MSRANKSDEPKRTTTQVDRRDVAATRVHFEALVEVGAGPSGGFEAESVDVSPDGMRLRTAYLPELGERLVCRFDGFGGEVVAEGEVTWSADSTIAVWLASSGSVSSTSILTARSCSTRCARRL